MFSGASALAALFALFSAGMTGAVDQGGAIPDQPVPYESLRAAAVPEVLPADGAAKADAGDDSSPDLRLRASLYHAGGGGAGGRDSLGCRPVAMRTLAVDPHVVPRRSVVFIRETVGMRLPDGSVHDGLWYASDTGGAIRGNRIDLFTGDGRGSMQPAMALNLKTLSVDRRGTFQGCPRA